MDYMSVNNYNLSTGYAMNQPKPVKKVEKKQGYVIVPQTRMAFLGYMLIFTSMIVMMIIHKDKPGFTAAFVPSFIMNLIVVTISLYVLNCTVTGSCNMYAWIVAYILIAFGIMGAISTIFMLR